MKERQQSVVKVLRDHYYYYDYSREIRTRQYGMECHVLFPVEISAARRRAALPTADFPFLLAPTKNNKKKPLNFEKNRGVAAVR